MAKLFPNVDEVHSLALQMRFVIHHLQTQHCAPAPCKAALEVAQLLPVFVERVEEQGGGVIKKHKDHPALRTRCISHRLRSCPPERRSQIKQNIEK